MVNQKSKKTNQIFQKPYDVLEKMIDKTVGKDLRSLRTKEFLNKIEKKNGNLWLRLGIVIGQKERLIPMVNEIYNQNKLVYHQSREQVFKDKYLYNLYPIHLEQNIYKVLGILAYEKEQNQFKQIDRLMKQGFKQSYNYLVNKKVININDYIKREFHRLEKIYKRDTLRPIEFLDSFITLIYFLLSEKSILDFTESEEKENFILKSIDTSMSDLHLGTDIQRVEKLEQLKEYDTDSFPEEVSKVIEIILDKVFKEKKEMYLYEALAEMYRKSLVDDDCIMDTEIYFLFLEIDITVSRKRPLFNMLKNISMQYLLYGFGEDYFTSYKITKEEFRQVLKYAIATYHVTETLESDIGFEIFFVNSLLMSNCLKEFNSLRKERVIDYETHELMIETQHQEDLEEKNKKIEQLEKQVEQLQQQNEVQKQQIEQSYINDIRQLQKQVKELEQELQVREDYSKEVFALREFVFNQQKEHETYRQDIDYEKELQDKNIIVVGGHDNWIRNMQKVLPNALFLNPDSQNRDYSRISQSDAVVFVNTLYNNHGVYYKVLSSIKHNNTSLFFIDKTNVNIALQYIYDCIVNK